MKKQIRYFTVTFYEKLESPHVAIIAGRAIIKIKNYEKFLKILNSPMKNIYHDSVNGRDFEKLKRLMRLNTKEIKYMIRDIDKTSRKYGFSLYSYVIKKDILKDVCRYIIDKNNFLYDCNEFFIDSKYYGKCNAAIKIMEFDKNPKNTAVWEAIQR